MERDVVKDEVTFFSSLLITGRIPVMERAVDEAFEKRGDHRAGVICGAGDNSLLFFKGLLLNLQITIA